MPGREAGFGEIDEEFHFRCSKFRWFGPTRWAVSVCTWGQSELPRTNSGAIPWNSATAQSCDKPAKGTLQGEMRPPPQQWFSNFTLDRIIQEVA